MANTYIKIATVTVTGTPTSIDFNSIPNTYTDLCLVYSARQSDDGDTLLQFNGSTTTYSGRVLFGTGSGTGSMQSGTNGAYNAGWPNFNSYTANTFSNIQIYIPNYAGSTNKSFSVDSVNENNATGVTTALVAGLWSNTAAITSISIKRNTGTFVANSTAYLYGISKS